MHVKLVSSNDYKLYTYCRKVTFNRSITDNKIVVVKQDVYGKLSETCIVTANMVS
uniref:Uncharacterized protein n=1 Tax=Arion vulgaris TaxID=1028688 RepID=A0A0B7ARR4_9EUPU